MVQTLLPTSARRPPIRDSVPTPSLQQKSPAIKGEAPSTYIRLIAGYEECV